MASQTSASASRQVLPASRIMTAASSIAPAAHERRRLARGSASAPRPGDRARQEMPRRRWQWPFRQASRAHGHDLGHVDLGHRLGKLPPLVFLGEVAQRLVEHRPVVAKPGNGRRKLMPSLRPYAIRLRLAVNAGSGGGSGGAPAAPSGDCPSAEAGPQPRLVRRVFQQPAHEVGHAGNHLAHGHVLANPQALLHQGLAERIGHAVELLKSRRPTAAVPFFSSSASV